MKEGCPARAESRLSGAPKVAVRFATIRRELTFDSPHPGPGFLEQDGWKVTRARRRVMSQSDDDVLQL